VERISSELLPHGDANAAAVAQKLGISSRSLSRRLKAEGVTFSTVLDELRQALAETYLEEHELSISEIAWLLGYEEVSSLTHAFKRWTGLTPRQFRQNQSTIQTHKA
jgi:AraC-like DNA-binding protein